MGPVALILGGITGTLSAVLGWLIFGLSFWGAAALYFAVALVVSSGLIAFALMRQKTRPARERAALQRA